MYVKKYDLALEKYKAAFATVDYLHDRNLKSAAKCAMAVEDYESAAGYIRQSVINCGNNNFFSTYNRAPSWKFKRTKHYKSIKDSLEIYLAVYNSRINWEYCAILDSLYFVDQYVLRGTRHAKADYNLNVDSLREIQNIIHQSVHHGKVYTDINVDSLRKIWVNLDSSNFQTLLECIDKWGWPSEEIVKNEYFILVLHHNMRLKENEKYHEMAFSAVKEGKYNPLHLSWWYGQYYTWYKGEGQQAVPTLFTPTKEEVEEGDFERVNKNRAAFYLKPLSAFELKVLKSGGVRMNELW